MDDLLKAVGSPQRREILRLLWADDERSAGDIHRALHGISFGGVSQHLSVLAASGLVTARAEGRQRFYRVRKAPLGALGEWLESMWGDALARLKAKAEMEEGRRGPRPRKGRRNR
jgi:DNA-binding transcriptional ArsR family regulator